MLKIHQGHYVGYDALEKDISITKLPSTLSPHNVTSGHGALMSTLKWNETIPNGQQNGVDAVDISGLKEMPGSLDKPRLNGTNRTPLSKVRPKHSFHNSYTIYEETSDLSGAESGVVDDASDAGSISSNGMLVKLSFTHHMMTLTLVDMCYIASRLKDFCHQR